MCSWGATARARPTSPRRSPSSRRSAPTASPAMRRWCATARKPRSSAHGSRTASDDVLLEVQLNRQGSNKARVNGAPVKPAELPRHAHVVLFAPEDLQIVRGDPSSRRAFRRSAARAAHAPARGRPRRLRPGAQAAHGAAEIARRRGALRGRRPLDARRLGRQARRARHRGHRGAPGACRGARDRRSRAAYAAIAGADHAPRSTGPCRCEGADPEEGAEAAADGCRGRARHRGTLLPSPRCRPARRRSSIGALTLVGPHRDDLAAAVRGLPVEGLRHARRIVVVRARAAARLRRAAARATPDSATRC